MTNEKYLALIFNDFGDVKVKGLHPDNNQTFNYIRSLFIEHVDDFTRGDYELPENPDDERSVYRWYNSMLGQHDCLDYWTIRTFSPQDNGEHLLIILNDGVFLEVEGLYPNNNETFNHFKSLIIKQVDNLTNGNYELPENLDDEHSFYEWYRGVIYYLESPHWECFVLSPQEAPLVELVE